MNPAGLADTKPPVEGQFQELSDIENNPFMEDDLEEMTFASHPFIDQLDMPHEPNEELHESTQEDDGDDLGDVLDDAASDDLTNALHSLTADRAVPVVSVSSSGVSLGSTASASSRSPGSGATPLTPPDAKLSPIADKLHMATIDTHPMPRDSLGNDSLPISRSPQSPTDHSSNENAEYHENDMFDHPAIQSQTEAVEPVQRTNDSGRSRISPTTQHPSLMQKVLSKTRPSYLPPKAKEEDQKHNKEWEEMMQRSRAAEQQRQTELQARRVSRELAIKASISQWERTVLPDWRKAVKDPEIQKLWWKGIPPKLRGVLWEKVIGNSLALSKDAYSSCISRAKNLQASRRFPTTALSLIESDISTTLPQLHIFHRQHGPLYEDLHNLLCAWVIARADEGLGYEEGIAKIGGMFLLNLGSPSQAFTAMRNLLERSCLRAFYGGHSAREDVEAYYRIFDTLLADTMPKVYFNFKQYQISPADYLHDWIIPLFLNHLPIEACARIWDVFLLEGDSFLFRASLSLLAAIESRLFFPDRDELLAVLKGENQAALEIARRDPNIPLRMDQTYVIPRYEIYGINEEIIWQRIAETADWWKESTWQRLLLRELPDA